MKLFTWGGKYCSTHASLHSALVLRYFPQHSQSHDNSYIAWHICKCYFSAIKFHEPNEFKVASDIRDTLNGFKQENQPQKHWERGQRGKHHHGAKINFDQQNAEKAREYEKTMLSLTTV